MVPFHGWGSIHGWGSTASRLEPLRGSSLLFTTKFPEIPGTHFIDLGKDERLSRPWSHPVVLKMGPLDWKFKYWSKEFFDDVKKNLIQYFVKIDDHDRMIRIR